MKDDLRARRRRSTAWDRVVAALALAAFAAFVYLMSTGVFDEQVDAVARFFQRLFA